MKQISLEEEYSKDTGITPQDIAVLRQWLKTQPHLPEKYITDLDLILAYYSCNCSTGLTKQVLDLNFTLRSLLGFLRDRKIDDRVKKIATNVLATPLSTVTKEGYKIFFIRLLNPDPKNFNLGDFLKCMFMYFDIIQYEEGTWPGVIFINDFNNTTLAHIAKMDLLSVQQVLCYLQESAFLKLKQIHFINAPSFVDKVLMLLKPFVKKEFIDMLHIHTPGSNTLDEFVPIEALPEECGGNSEHLEEYRDIVLSKLHDYKDLFELDKRRRVDEALRAGKPKTISDIFGGVEGSFKKLDID